jgi:hypothetical protein
VEKYKKEGYRTYNTGLIILLIFRSGIKCMVQEILWDFNRELIFDYLLFADEAEEIKREIKELI